MRRPGRRGMVSADTCDEDDHPRRKESVCSGTLRCFVAEQDEGRAEHPCLQVEGLTEVSWGHTSRQWWVEGTGSLLSRPGDPKLSAGWTNEEQCRHPC